MSHSSPNNPAALDQEDAGCPLCPDAGCLPYDVIQGARFVKCAQCGLVYQRPRIGHRHLMTKGAIKYDKAYFYREGGRLDNTSAKIERARRELYDRELAKVDQFRNGGKIFDVGCGTGRFLNHLPEKWEKHGCDISADGVEIAREVYGLANIHLGEFEKLPLPAAHFDVVYFRASLHHVYNPVTSLAKAADILKPGGLLVIFTNMRDSASGRLLRCRTRTVNPNINYFFDEKNLAALLGRFGFQIRDSLAPYWGTDYASWKDPLDLAVSAFLVRVIRPLGLALGLNPFDKLVGPAWHRNSVEYFATRNP